MQITSIIAAFILPALAIATPTARATPGLITSPQGQSSLTTGQPFLLSVEGLPQNAERFTASISVRIDGTGKNTYQSYLNLDAITRTQTTFSANLTIPAAAPKGYYCNIPHIDIRTFLTAVNVTDDSVYIASGPRSNVDIV